MRSRVSTISRESAEADDPLPTTENSSDDDTDGETTLDEIIEKYTR